VQRRAHRERPCTADAKKLEFEAELQLDRELPARSVATAAARSEDVAVCCRAAEEQQSQM
jgi:hypothetical protein